MTTRYFALLALVACNAAAPAMPWLYGLDNVVSATGAPPRAPADDIADGCSAGASRSIELVADVAAPAGRETIVASYSGGIAIFDREDRLVAETPGYRCEGSADELDVVAFGTAYGEPMLAVAATGGGRRETATWIGLFRITQTIDATFTAVVETRSDEVVTRGAIYLLPEGLLYHRPNGRLSVWRLDAASRIYVPVLPETPHDEPVVSLR